MWRSQFSIPALTCHDEWGTHAGCSWGWDSFLTPRARHPLPFPPINCLANAHLMFRNKGEDCPTLLCQWPLKDLCLLCKQNTWQENLGKSWVKIIPEPCQVVGDKGGRCSRPRFSRGQLYVKAVPISSPSAHILHLILMNIYCLMCLSNCHDKRTTQPTILRFVVLLPLSVVLDTNYEREASPGLLNW